MMNHEKGYWIGAVAIMAAFVGSVTLLFHDFSNKKDAWISYASATERYTVMHFPKDIAVIAARPARIHSTGTLCTVDGFPEFRARSRTIYLFEKGEMKVIPYSQEEYNRLMRLKPEEP